MGIFDRLLSDIGSVPSGISQGVGNLGGDIKRTFTGGHRKPSAEIPATMADDSPASYNQFLEATGASKGMKQSVRMPKPGQRIQATEGFDSYNPIEWAQGNLKTNDMSGNMRLGGQFTDTGLELNSKLSELNAADRMKARSLIGIGGTLAPGYGY